MRLFLCTLPRGKLREFSVIVALSVSHSFLRLESLKVKAWFRQGLNGSNIRAIVKHAVLRKCPITL